MILAYYSAVPQQQERKIELKEWYQKSCLGKVQDAIAASQEGAVASVETALILARAYGEKSGTVLDEVELSQILQVAYKNGLIHKIQETKSAKQNSDTAKAANAIRLARSYAQKADIRIDESEWEKLAITDPDRALKDGTASVRSDAGRSDVETTPMQRLEEFTILKSATQAVLYDRSTLYLKQLPPKMADNLAVLLNHRDALMAAPGVLAKVSAIVDYMTDVKLDVSQKKADENANPCHEDQGAAQPAHDVPRHQILDRLAINIANSCNLACTYCYANKGVYGAPGQFLMTPELIETTLVRFTERFQLINHIQFMGGEPSLNPDAIERAALAIRKLVDKGKLAAPAGLGMVSNGLSYSEKFWSVLKKYKCGVTISLDGPKEVHDYARMRKDGSGSFDKIRDNIKRARDEGIRIGFEATFSKAHLKHGMSLIDLCQWFYDEFGHRILHAPPMAVNPYETKGDDELGLTNEEKIREYCATAEWGIDNLRGGKMLMHGFTERILRTFQTQRKNTVCCPAGISQLSVSTTGEVSPCWMFTDEKPFHMGDVGKDDFLGPRSAAVVQALGEFDLTTHSDCQKCWIQPACFGCRGADYHATKTINGKTECDFMRALVETVILKTCEVYSALNKTAA